VQASASRDSGRVEGGRVEGGHVEGGREGEDMLRENGWRTLHVDDDIIVVEKVWSVCFVCMGV